MDERIVIIIIVFAIILIGFGRKKYYVYQCNKRKSDTTTFKRDFLEFINKIKSSKIFDEELHSNLVRKSRQMQMELGQDGVLADYIDPMRGIHIRDYQLMINLLEQSRDFYSMMSSGLMYNNYYFEVGNCDNMFIRHISRLDDEIISTKKTLFNPLSCFGEGVRFLLNFPLYLLYWCGIISVNQKKALMGSWVVKFFSKTVIVIGLFSAIVTIVIGWNEFWQKIAVWISSFKK